MSAQAETEQQQTNEVTKTLQQFLKVLGGEFIEELAPDHDKKKSGRVFLWDRLEERMAGVQTHEQQLLEKQALLGLVNSSILKLEEKTGHLSSSTFRSIMLGKLQSEEFCSDQELKLYSLWVLARQTKLLANEISHIAALQPMFDEVSLNCSVFDLGFSDSQLLDILNRQTKPYFTDVEKHTLSFIFAKLENAIQFFNYSFGRVGEFLALAQDRVNLKEAVLMTVGRLSKKTVKTQSDLLLIDFLSPRTRVKVTEDADEEFNYSYNALFKKLNLEDKAKVQRELLELCKPNLEEGARVRAVIQVALLACKGAANLLPTSGGARIDDFRKNLILATYNHFAALLGARAVVHLLDFDTAFKQMVFQDTTHFSPLFGYSVNTRFRMDASVALSGDKKSEFKTVNLKTSGSMSRSMEEVKFLYVQQIVMTAGTIFANKQNLKPVIQFLAQHRTWHGRLAQKLFGFQTDAQKCVSNYYEKINKATSELDKARLATCIQEYMNPRVEKYGALESGFLGMAMHPQGMHIAPELQRGITAH